jgi:hypothetical protein
MDGDAAKCKRLVLEPGEVFARLKALCLVESYACPGGHGYSSFGIGKD